MPRMLVELRDRIEDLDELRNRITWANMVLLYSYVRLSLGISLFST